MAKVIFHRPACPGGGGCTDRCATYEDIADNITITTLSTEVADPMRIDYKIHDPDDPENPAKDRVGFQEFPQAEGWDMVIVAGV